MKLNEFATKAIFEKEVCQSKDNLLIPILNSVLLASKMLLNPGLKFQEVCRCQFIS